MVHYDRFILPSITLVDYALGEDSHILVNAICTPVSAFETKVYAVIYFRLTLPGWLVQPFITPIAMRIFQQDCDILTEQTKLIEQFGGERYISTEIDILGGQIWRLLRRAADDRLAEDERPWKQEVRMLV